MKIPAITLCLLCAGALPATANEQLPTLASCTEILPPGQNLEFKFEGTITTKLSEPDVIKGTFSLSDGEDREGPPAWREELEQFLACVQPWVDGSDGQN